MSYSNGLGNLQTPDRQPGDECVAELEGDGTVFGSFHQFQQIHSWQPGCNQAELGERSGQPGGIRVGCAGCEDCGTAADDLGWNLLRVCQ